MISGLLVVVLLSASAIAATATAGTDTVLAPAGKRAGGAPAARLTLAEPTEAPAPATSTSHELAHKSALPFIVRHSRLGALEARSGSRNASQGAHSSGDTRSSAAAHEYEELPATGHEAKSHASDAQGPIYTNQFVIEVKGGEQEARKLAAKHGFVYLNHILADYYHLEHRRLAKRSTSQVLARAAELSGSIKDEPQVSIVCYCGRDTLVDMHGDCLLRAASRQSGAAARGAASAWGRLCGAQVAARFARYEPRPAAINWHAMKCGR